MQYRSYIWSFRPGQLQNYKLPGRAILFLRAFCLRFCSLERAVPELLLPVPRLSEPAPASVQLRSATCEPQRGPRLREEPLLSCVFPIRSSPGGAEKAEKAERKLKSVSWQCQKPIISKFIYTTNSQRVSGIGDTISMKAGIMGGNENRKNV